MFVVMPLDVGMHGDLVDGSGRPLASHDAINELVKRNLKFGQRSCLESQLIRFAAFADKAA